MAEPSNVEDFETIARDLIQRGPYDYYAGGAEDEITLRENRAAFRRTFLRYRVLVDVSQRDMRTSLLGVDMPFPVLLAPTALHRMAHPEGELATARGAGSLSVLQTLSSVSSETIENVAAAAPDNPRWFQLYVYSDRPKAESLVKRAEAAGYRAIVLTVDLPVLGRRERDLRNDFLLPEDVTAANLVDIATEDVAPQDLLVHDQGLTWADIAWLRSITSLPVVIKGVVRSDDAEKAVDAGVDAIWVSNHGGRQLDTSVPSLDALREIAPAVRGRVPLILDGGVRRGTDILKAIALGANAVAVGRPQLWGLAAGGAEGVATVLAMLRDEFSIAMALAGCKTLDDIDASLIAPT